MSQMVLMLTDGPHVVSSPTYYAFELMEQSGALDRISSASAEALAALTAGGPAQDAANAEAAKKMGLSVADYVTEMAASAAWRRVLSVAVAALLTDSEELDGKHEPVKVWGVAETAKLIPIDRAANDVLLRSVIDLFSQAQQGASSGDALPPTSPRGGEKHSPSRARSAK